MQLTVEVRMAAAAVGPILKVEPSSAAAIVMFACSGTLSVRPQEVGVYGRGLSPSGQLAARSLYSQEPIGTLAQAAFALTGT